MKKIIKKLKILIPFTLLAVLFFLQGSCDKNDSPKYELPSVTQTGENTIGCLVDGVVLVPNRGSGWNVPKTKRFKYDEETGDMFFDITFYAEEEDYESGYAWRVLLFSADSIFSEGEVDRDKFSATLRTHPEYLGELKTYRYRSTMTEISGVLEITKLDKTKNIISGVFEFYAYRGTTDDYDPDDKIEITKGRFDFKYRQDGGYVTGYYN